MDRADWIVAIIVLALSGSQVAAAWVGLRLRRRLGWLGPALALLVPPVVALGLLVVLLQRSDPCPPEYELPCGEGILMLLFSGLACAGVNLLVAAPVQIGVGALLRKKEEERRV